MAGKQVQRSAKAKTPTARWSLLRRLGVFALVLIVGLAVWFNGPGVRWLGPKFAVHMMANAGLEGELKMGGSLLGGLDVYDLEVRSGGSIERLAIGRLETEYRISEVFSGKIRGVSGENVSLELRLIETGQEGSPPLDFAALGQRLSQVRSLLQPMDVDLKNLNLSLRKGDALVFAARENSLRHHAGSAEISLALGRITDALGRTLPAQQAEILWTDGKLALNEIDLLPGLGIHDLIVSLPESGEFEATGKLRLEQAEFKLDLTAGGEKLRLDLVEGSLDLAQAAAGLGMQVPVAGQLASLAVEASGVFPEWKHARATANMSVKTFSYGDWGFPELALGVSLNGDGGIEATLAGQGLDTTFTIAATSRIETQEPASDGMRLAMVSGNVKVDEADQLLVALAQKFSWKNDFEHFPASTLAGKWTMNMSDPFQFSVVDFELSAKQATASPIRLNASYRDGAVDIAGLEAGGFTASGRYDFRESSYQGRHVMQDFDSSSVQAWIDGMGIELAGAGVFNLEWQGRGDFQQNSHQGSVKDFSAVWKRREMPEITASGALDYHWPGMVKIDDWLVTAADQQLRLDAELKDEWLLLRRFDWLDGGQAIAKGTGRIPFPKSYANLDAFIAENSSPLEFEIKTETLQLAKLRPWIRRLEQIHEDATAHVELKVSGSFAAPVVDADVAIRQIKFLSRPGLPSADLTMKVAANDGLARISAKALASDLPAATFEATIPFRPMMWAKEAGSFQNEVVDGELELPSSDLSRFQALLPDASSMGGTLTGNAKVTGKLGSPEIKANLNLDDGRLVMKDSGIPELVGIDFDLAADAQHLSFKGRVRDVSGGNLRVNGSFDTTPENGRELDINIIGAGLPVVRNEFLILRINTDLKINGPLESALVSGDVGIIDSLFYKEVELLPVGKPFLEPKPAKLPSVDVPTNPGRQTPDALKAWTADVNLKTVDPILIRGNFGKGGVDVALNLTGTLGEPIPNGSVVLRQAVLRLPFSVLKISQGMLKFNAQTGFDPNIDLHATAEPSSYQVAVYANGRMSNPQLILTSQPPLPENEIMTLLASGTTTDGLGNPQQAASLAIRLLIEEFSRGRLPHGDEQDSALEFLDNVDFSIADPDPYTADVYNSATLKLTRKWSVSAGVDEENDQRMMLTWKLKFK